MPRRNYKWSSQSSKGRPRPRGPREWMVSGTRNSKARKARKGKMDSGNPQRYYMLTAMASAAENNEFESRHLRLTHYTYRPLSSGRNEIRLLQLPPLRRDRDKETVHPAVSEEFKAGLCHFPLETSPEYLALSYRWARNNDTERIFIDERSFTLSVTLKCALQQLRHVSQTKFIWVDALCINQKDEKERSEQVSKMRDIYSLATRVVAWIGEGYSSTDPSLAFNLVRNLYSHIDDSHYLENEISKIDGRHDWKALVQILEQEYWRRIWVIQEVNSARKLTLRYGSETMEWEHFAAVQRKLASLPSSKHYSVGDTLDLWKSIFNGGPKILSLPNSTPDTPGPLSLFQALDLFRYHFASDPRDMVYALVGLTKARDDPLMLIDYSHSVRQVYIQVVDYVLARDRKLDIICAKFADPYLDLPSWAPDWAATNLRITRPLMSRPPGMPKFSASKSVPAVAKIVEGKDVLRAYGFRIDSVDIFGGVQDEFLNRRKRSMDTFRGLDAATLRWYTMSMSRVTEGRESHDNSFVRTITCDIAEDDPVLLRKILGGICKELPRDASLPDRLLALVNELQEPETWVGSWMRLAYSCLIGRTFFMSKQGLMGLCPLTYTVGDIIVIILGCSVPVLLRPRGGYYDLIGDVYLQGYMYGKGIEELSEGKFEREVFEIR